METVIGGLPESCVDCCARVTRKELFAHRQLCGEVAVKCPFHFGEVRCDTHLRRKELSAHMAVASGEHIALLSIAKADAIIPILSMLRDGQSDELSFAVVVALKRLAFVDVNRVTMVASGAVKPLSVLLGEGTADWIRLEAADLLLVLGLETFTGRGIERCLTVVAPLLGVLRGDSCSSGCSGSSGRSNDRVMEAAVWVLAYLAGCSVNRVTMIREGAVAMLVSLLSDTVDAIRDAAIWALIRISKDDVSLIADPGVVTLLVSLLPLGSVAAATALRNLSRCKENNVAIVKAGAVIPLLVLVERGSRWVVAAEALRNLACAVMAVANGVVCDAETETETDDSTDDE